MKPQISSVPKSSVKSMPKDFPGFKTAGNLAGFLTPHSDGLCLLIGEELNLRQTKAFKTWLEDVIEWHEQHKVNVLREA